MIPNNQKTITPPKRLNLMVAHIDATKGENIGYELGEVNINIRFTFSITSKNAAKKGIKVILYPHSCNFL